MAAVEQNDVTEPAVQDESMDLTYQIYRIRYVELTRPIAGAVLGGINYGLARYTDLNDSSINLVGNTFANLAAWLLGELIVHNLCLKFNLYTESTSKNPLYRNFKTLASLGYSIGSIFAIIVSSTKNLKLNNAVFSAFASFILGISAFAYRWARKDHTENINEQLGVEGWSKYTKMALTLGLFLGQSIGGYISYVNSCDDITSWSNITFYGSIFAVVSFAFAALLVPVVNSLMYKLHDGKKMGILVADNKDLFNTNYVRSGMTLGAAFGSILGGLLGPAIITGLTPAIGIAVGSSLFAIISGILLGVYGYAITLKLKNDWKVLVDTDNSWSYASRNTSYVFGFIGTIFACIFCPGASLLQTIAFASAISSLIGWFAGFGVMWTARCFELKEQKTEPTELPWTQRISTGANRGAIIGSCAGLILGLCIGGPLGLIGWISFFGAMAAIIGAAIGWLNNEVAKIIIIEKILRIDNVSRITTAVAPDNNTNSDTFISETVAAPIVNTHPAEDNRNSRQINTGSLRDESAQSKSRCPTLCQNLYSSLMFFSPNKQARNSDLLGSSLALQHV